MNLKQLSHFVALTEHRNFVKAAEACQITQPAFSRSIRSLEESLGFSLIDRYSGRNLQPTVEGERVLELARTVLENVARMASDTRDSDDLEPGILVLGCGPVPALDLVPQTVARFTNCHPQMRVRLEVENWQKLTRSLQRDEVEFIVASINRYALDPNYEVHPLQPQRLGFYCRKEHPLLHHDKSSARELFAYPVAISGAAKEQIAALAHLNNQNVHIGVECDNTHSLLKICSLSDHIAVLPVSIERHLSEHSALTRIANIKGNFETAYARYGVVTRRGHRLSRRGQRFIEYLAEIDSEQPVGNQTLTLAI